MNLITADNGMRLGPGSGNGNIELTFGFTFTPDSGRPEGAGSDQVTATFAAAANQATVRTAVRTALKAWADGRGDVIVRHILSDLTIVVP